MLPEYLCEQLCSLKPNEDRLTFSCFLKLSPSGDLLEEARFSKSVIRQVDYNLAEYPL